MPDTRLLSRNPGLRELLAAQLISEAGTWLAYVAVTVAVYARTGSAAWVSATLLVGFAPNVLLAPVAGVLADRLPRRALLIGSDLSGALVFAAFPLATGPLQLVALAALAGAIAAISRPALQSSVPNLVREDDLERANAALQTTATLGLTGGPLLAALLVSAIGTGVVFAANALSFAISACLIARLPRERFQVARAVEESLRHAAAAGFRIFTRNRILTVLLASWVLACVGAGALNVGEILLAEQAFHAGTSGFGLLASSCGAGLMLGSWASARMLYGRNPLPVYAVGLAICALGDGAAALAPSIWVAAAFAAVGGFGNGLFMAGKNIVLQRAVPDALRGRAFALLYGSGDAAMGGGMIVAGLVGAGFGARTLWGLGAVAFALAAAAVLLAQPRRQLVAPALGEASL
jgi:MFS family permease